MSLRTRILFLILLSLTGTILLTASILTWNARQSLLDEQRADGEAMARVLARAAYIVQVGPQANVLNAAHQQVSLARLGQELVQSGDVRAIRIVDSEAETQVFNVTEGISRDLSALDLSMLKSVLAQGQGQAYVEDRLLKVIQPIRQINFDEPNDNATDGAVIIFLPTERLQAAIERQLAQAILAALAVLLGGVALSIIMSRMVTRPLNSFRAAATSVQSGSYQPELLQTVITRTDELGRLGLVFDQMAREVGTRDRRLNLLRVIIPMGVALSAEKDFSRLLETIVIEAQKITNADAGSLYLLIDDKTLKFMIVRNQTLNIALGGTTGLETTLHPIPLYDEQGRPNHRHIASYCALTGESVSLEDAYTTARFDLTGTREFDAQTGYRSRSMLTIPLKDTSNNVIGVLQLLNAKDPKTNDVVPFPDDEVIDSLVLITSAALSAYIREETLRNEINKLRIEIDHAKQNKQVNEIAESDYFKNLEIQAEAMRKKRKS